MSDVGRALGRAYGTNEKHGIKQVDRLLSNKNISMDQVFSRSVPWLVGQRRRIVVSLDWTEYDKDGHSRIALNLVTDHGRATPLVWMTVKSDRLKGRRNHFEDKAIATLVAHLPSDVEVYIRGVAACVADQVKEKFMRLVRIQSQVTQVLSIL